MVNVCFWGDLESGKTKELTAFGLEGHGLGYVVESNYWTRFPVTPFCEKFSHPGRSFDGWCYSEKVHLRDYVDFVASGKKGALVLRRSIDDKLILQHEIHTEIDARLFSSTENIWIGRAIYQIAKGGTSFGWDSPRFEDADVRVRTVTPNTVMCLWGESAWITLMDNQITGEFAPYEASKDVVSLIGRCYNTSEKNE